MADLGGLGGSIGPPSNLEEYKKLHIVIDTKHFTKYNNSYLLKGYTYYTLLHLYMHFIIQIHKKCLNILDFDSLKTKQPTDAVWGHCAK